MIAIITESTLFEKQIKQLFSPKILTSNLIVTAPNYDKCKDADIFVTDNIDIPKANKLTIIFVPQKRDITPPKNTYYFVTKNFQINEFKQLIEKEDEKINYLNDTEKRIALLITENKNLSETIKDFQASLYKSKRMQNEIMTKIDIPDFQIAIHYQPELSVSGDIFLAEKIGNKIFIMIADVTSHGYFAGIYGTSLFSLAKGFLAIASKFETNLLQWSHWLYNTSSFYKGTGTDSQMCSATALLCEIDLDKNIAQFINCGHGNEAPIFISKEETKFIKCDKIYMPIGEFTTSYPSETTTIKFEKGDALLFYTDGVTEIFQNEKENLMRQYSTTRLLSSAKHEIQNKSWTPKSLISGVCKDAESYSTQDDMRISTEKGNKIKNSHDDITLACLKWENK